MFNVMYTINVMFLFKKEEMCDVRSETAFANKRWLCFWKKQDMLEWKEQFYVLSFASRFCSSKDYYRPIS